MNTNNPLQQGSEKDVVSYISSSSNALWDNEYINVKSDLISVTHDKLENTLLKFYKRYVLKYELFNPLSLFCGVVLTLTTTDFKNESFGLTGVVWNAIFLLTALACGVWALIVLVKLVIYRNELSIEFLINRIKNIGAQPKP
jgi:hypothetical protein